MTIEHQIGQMLMPQVRIGLYMTDPEYRNRIQSYVREHHVGGFIIFEGARETTRHVTQELQSLSKTPMFFAADLEPGLSPRIIDNTSFPHAMAIGRTSPAMCEEVAECIGREAASLGINVNFAPVCDVNNNPENPIVNIRAFGETPEHVSTYANAFIRGTQHAGIYAIAKHFPGHGDTAVDSHLALPHLDFSRKRFDELEFVPFINALNEGADGIMVAHVIASALDPVFPATLSKAVIHDILRGELGYNGLVFTDALEMHAISKNYTADHVAMFAALAGNDILLMPPDLERVCYTLKTEAKSNPRLSEIISQANERIALAKASLRSAESSQYIKKDASSLAVTIAEQSLQVTGKLGKIAKKSKIAVIFIGSESEKANMHYAHAHLEANYKGKYDNPICYMNDVNILKRNIDAAILLIFNGVNSYQGNLGDTKRFRAVTESTLLSGAKNVIGVSLGNPYIWQNLPPISTTITCYSNSKVTIEAVMKKLFGNN